MTLTFWTVKGGAGKSSLCYLFARVLAEQSKSVLVVDIDPQSSISQAMTDEQPNKTLFDFFVHREPLPIVETDIDGVKLAPAALQLLKVATVPEAALRKAIAAESFDCVLIDCPPTYGPTVATAIVAASKIIMPTQTSRFDLTVLQFCLAEIADLNPEAEKAIILNRVRNAAKLTKEETAYSDLLDDVSQWLTKTTLPNSALVRRIVDQGASLNGAKAKVVFHENLVRLVDEVCS